MTIRKLESKIKIKIKKEGFTLLEMLVAIGVFLISIGIITGIFVTAIRQQRMALTSQTISDQTSFALEYMGRALRLAKKELAAPTCLSQSGLNYEIPVAYRIGGNENIGTGLRFINHLQGDECQEFFLENGRLKYRSPRWPQPLDLTSNKLEITSLRFVLAGKSQNDPSQPLVTIFLEIRSPLTTGPLQKMKIQTSISQRNLDVTY